MALTRAANCGLDKQLYTSQFRNNEVAAGISTAFLIITSLLYGYNIIRCSLQIVAQRNATPDPKPKKADLAVNPLSAFLASAVGLVLIFGTWPQPLEGAGLLVIALAQASVLGWQDHDTEWRAIPEKLPDVAAVVVAAYALYDSRNRYTEISGNEFFQLHDPVNDAMIAGFLTAVGFAIRLAQQVLVAMAKDSTREKLVVRICSAFFVASQCTTFGLALWFGISTIPNGCVVFNTTKISALVALGFGLIYSAVIALWSSLAERVSVSGQPQVELAQLG
ncbi:hypothetical protein LTS02_007993 [Friedmanniomyces endolithicus]|nr:hypothetical protein LTR94_022533 [Friedmanniomyces endolithicus]KAK0768089.1 hypothetical protein LTR59_017939 [Friedmanniomyces endolithicus]KAK0770322.1 hypothetical protein LTR75_017946 [Friedmanniomyces endolithicus]KAK0770592.1 hypothetical protein LTR38_017535 [Friedmanniomyces endolithicus]KAK0838193.1 hypothetical protein LTR03_012231 [Friedmanniomyces endolithicus]